MILHHVQNHGTMRKSNRIRNTRSERSRLSSAMAWHPLTSKELFLSRGCRLIELFPRLFIGRMSRPTIEKTTTPREEERRRMSSIISLEKEVLYRIAALKSSITTYMKAANHLFQCLQKKKRRSFPSLNRWKPPFNFSMVWMKILHFTSGSFITLK